MAGYGLPHWDTLGPTNAPQRRIEVSWFDRTDLSLGYICRTGLLTSEPLSLLHTDTHNAHTDDALQSHLTAEMMRGRPEKRGARARRSHDTQEHRAACINMVAPGLSAQRFEASAHHAPSAARGVCGAGKECCARPSLKDGCTRRAAKFEISELRLDCGFRGAL